MTLALPAFVIGLALLAGACHGSTEPKEPVWNKQPCDHCHMLLSEPRFAAQLLTPNGERRYFDDVGCLASFVSAHPEALAHAWVREAEHWRDVQSARFSAGAQTPMGFGYVADAHGTLRFDAIAAEITRTHAHRDEP